MSEKDERKLSPAEQEVQRLLMQSVQQQRVIMSYLSRSHIRHGWLSLIVKDLETNPHTQYKVHLWGVVYWLINFPLVTLLFFFEPTLWLKLGIFITLIYSIYANFATDYGAMSAAMAAYGDPLPELPLESHVRED